MTHLQWAPVGMEKRRISAGEVGVQPHRIIELTFLAGGQIVAKFVPNTDRTKVDVDYPDQPHGSTNLPEGVVHILREPPPRTDNGTTDKPFTDGGANTELCVDENTLAVLAVPSWMTPSDFLSFVEPAAEGIVHLRMIRCVSGPSLPDPIEMLMRTTSLKRFGA